MSRTGTLTVKLFYLLRNALLKLFLLISFVTINRFEPQIGLLRFPF